MKIETELQFLTATILEFAATGRIPGHSGDGNLVALPHGVYRCASAERWVALSASSDARVGDAPAR